MAESGVNVCGSKGKGSLAPLGQRGGAGDSASAVAKARRTFPYRNTEEEHSSDVREWIARHRGPWMVGAIRAEDTPRSRAILALARLDAEYTGIHWDSIPWVDDSGGSFCQSWYVDHAMTRVDYLIDSKAMVLPHD